MNALKVTARGDREIVMTRVFNAPRTLVWDAFTKPEMLSRWLLGPPGWTMPVCQLASKVGDSYRYVWRSPDGTEMGMGGVLREFVPPSRMVATEKFDQAWYSGEAVGTIELVEHNGQTTLTQTIVYESKEARDMVLKSPMEQGVGMSYNRLEEVLLAAAA
ncbi:MAG TPA: SRPBCC family protein [Candidatus Solibacter sp.]|nr:SRPBCC family protein [Candidatus Solibacter sp.]